MLNEVFKSIEAHKVTWSEKDEAERNLLKEQTNLQLLKNLGHQVNCPACGLGDTFLSTSYYDPSEYFGFDSDEYEIYTGLEDDNNESY